MENSKENIIRLLEAMIKSKRDLARGLSDDHMDFRRTLRKEAVELEFVTFLLEDQSYFDEYVEIYLREEDKDNG